MKDIVDNELDNSPIMTTQSQQTKFILGSSIFIPNIWLPDKLYQFLRKELNFPNPEFYTKERFGYSTWQTQRWIKMLEIVSDGILVPIGYLKKLIQYCDTNQISFQIIDKRVTTRKTLFSSKLTLRQDQKKILTKLNLLDRPILEAQPGFGKTMVALAYMKKRQQRTLIIVHTSTLLHQWTKRINDFLICQKVTWELLVIING